MTIHRRSFLKLSAGTAVASAGLGLGAPAIVCAATPVKMTLPWLPLGTFSYARREQDGLLAKARPRGHHRPRLRLRPGLRARGSGTVRLRHPRPGGDDELRGAGARPGRSGGEFAAPPGRPFFPPGGRHHPTPGARGADPVPFSCAAAAFPPCPL